MITEPELLDIVDDAWLRDKLPDDSELLLIGSCLVCCVKRSPTAHQPLASLHMHPPSHPLLFAQADVPLPHGMHGFVEELDEQQDQLRPPAKQKERWLDLGLQQLH